MSPKNINILDVLLILAKNKNTIIKITFSILVISVIIALVLPKSYKSTMQFFPPPSEQMGFGGILNSILPSAPTSSKLSSEAILIVLRSRTLKEKIIKKFNLVEYYGIEVPEKLIETINSNMIINEYREGGFGFNPIVSIEFSFIDESPEMAENITKSFVFYLDSMIQNINYERLSHTFEKLEKRYKQNITEIKNAEEKFKAFQEKYGVFQIESQMQALIENIAKLKSTSIQLEIQINSMSKFVTDQNHSIQKLKTQKSEIDNKIQNLTNQAESYQFDQVFLPLNYLPDIIQQYSKLYREKIVQEKIYEVIYPQYEQLKMQVNNVPIGIQILDIAVQPTEKYKPKRILIVLAGFMLSIFISLIVIFLNEIINTSAHKDKISSIKKYLFLNKFFR